MEKGIPSVSQTICRLQHFCRWLDTIGTPFPSNWNGPWPVICLLEVPPKKKTRESWDLEQNSFETQVEAPTSPNTAPATKSYKPRSPSIAPATYFLLVLFFTFVYLSLSLLYFSLLYSFSVSVSFLLLLFLYCLFLLSLCLVSFYLPYFFFFFSFFFSFFFLLFCVSSFLYVFYFLCSLL